MRLLRKLWRWLWAPRAGDTVFVLVISHKHGHYTTVHLSQELAWGDLTGYVEAYKNEAWWPEDFTLAKTRGDAPEMIRSYFHENERESYVIEEAIL